MGVSLEVSLCGDAWECSLSVQGIRYWASCSKVYCGEPGLIKLFHYSRPRECSRRDPQSGGRVRLQINLGLKSVHFLDHHVKDLGPLLLFNCFAGKFDFISTRQLKVLRQPFYFFWAPTSCFEIQLFTGSHNERMASCNFWAWLPVTQEGSRVVRRGNEVINGCFADVLFFL